MTCDLPAPSPLPKHLAGLDEGHSLGTRRKVIGALRELAADYLTAENDTEIRALEGCRKAYAQLIKHYEDEIRWQQDFDLVNRVRELEAQLANQQIGDGIVRTGKDSAFGAGQSTTSH